MLTAFPTCDGTDLRSIDVPEGKSVHININSFQYLKHNLFLLLEICIQRQNQIRLSSCWAMFTEGICQYECTLVTFIAILTPYKQIKHWFYMLHVIIYCPCTLTMIE